MVEALSINEYDAINEELGSDVLPVREYLHRLGRERFIAYVATRSLRDLYFFDRAILGYGEMVPHLHGEMCKFAEQPILRKMFLIPRGHYKSSCISIGQTLQRVLADPLQRIAIYHEKATQAEDFLKMIKVHCERNKLLRALYPERMPPNPIPKGWTWRADRMDLPRPKEYPESTVTALGVGGASQGKHYTGMVWDDLIGEEAANNEEVMEKIVDWMKKGESLSVTPANLVLDIIGTRWAFYDIYSWAMEEGYSSLPVFHRSAIIDKGGSPAPVFPEQFTMETLNELAQRDYYIFSCQYLNDPVATDVTDFNPAWLRYYQKTEKVEHGNRSAYALQEEVRESDGSDGEKLSNMTVLIHCDPGPGMVEGLKKRSNRHSRSAITVVGLAWPRRVFILDVFAARCSTDDYIDKICDYVDAYDDILRCLSMEAHSWTHMLKAPLLKRARERSTPIHEGRIRDYSKSSNQKKEGRIRKLTEYFRRGNVFLERGQAAFEQEYRSFPKGRTADILDSFAQGPEYWEPWPEGPREAPGWFEESTVSDDRNAVTGY